MDTLLVWFSPNCVARCITFQNENGWSCSTATFKDSLRIKCSQRKAFQVPPRVFVNSGLFCLQFGLTMRWNRRIVQNFRRQKQVACSRRFRLWWFVSSLVSWLWNALPNNSTSENNGKDCQCLFEFRRINSIRFKNLCGFGSILFSLPELEIGFCVWRYSFSSKLSWSIGCKIWIDSPWLSANDALWFGP